MSKIADTEANATSLDGLVNDNGLIATLRNGPKPSYQYLVDGWTTEVNELLERTAGVGAENAYETTAAGLAATVDGDYFSVITDSDESYLDLYKNESGVAAFQKSYPSAEALKVTGAWINVTASYPLASGYYDFNSAVRKISESDKKLGLIITYEISANTWETVEFRGDDLVTDWTVAIKWVNHNYQLVGVKRFDVSNQYFKQGMILNYIDDGGVRIFEQYIGPKNPTTSEFRDNDNWVQLETRDVVSSVLEGANETKDKVQSLQNSLYEDAGRLDFVNGAINSSTGEITNLTDPNKVITPRPLTVTDLESITVPSDFQFIITELDEDKNYLANAGWVNSKTTFNENTRYIMLMIKRVPETSLLPIDITKDVLTITSKLKPAWKEFYSRERISNDALSGATVVSDWERQKMAHVSTVTEDNYSDGGFLWSGYYASEDTYSENIFSNVDCKLLKMNPCDFSDAEEFNALSKNEIVGSFQQSGSTAPYDPTLIINENDIQFLMVADNVNDSEGIRYVNRTFDKLTDTFASSIENLNIRYVHDSTTYTEIMSNNNLTVMFERLFNRTGVDFGSYPIFSGRIVQSGGFHWIYLGSLCFDPTGIQGCILKSVDGITWDYVSAPPLSWYGVWEGAVEVVGDYVYCLLKADNRYRMYKYDHVNDTWDNEIQITGQTLSRPFLWNYNDKLYAIYNGVNITNTWGTINRSSVVISVMDKDNLDILDQQIINCDTASHYMSATAFKGTPYYMFTEDRRKHDKTQMKGNVSIIRMDFLNV